MSLEVKIPSPGESITEVEIASWLVADGAQVEKDQEIAEVESDKATLPLIAEAAGKITLKADEGETINVGSVVALIDTEAVGEAPEKPAPEKNTQEETPAPEVEAPSAKPESQSSRPDAKQQAGEGDYPKAKVSPLAEKLMEEKGLSLDDVINGLRRISKSDVETVADLPEEKPQTAKPEPEAPQSSKGTRITKTTRMSSLRRKLSQRLVSVKNETAMLTTFNEVDMSEVIRLRKQYKQAFIDTHGTKLGFMSFFAKAATMALMDFPEVASILDGENLITHQYADLGIAVQTPKGLMVPIIRNAETFSLAALEHKIADMAQRASRNKIALEEMSGGTFTITNGGTFGSMLSTPILNPPQTAILGMHNIVERPMAVNGKVEIRPVMYLALSYDHRVLDGATSVRFLVRIKELVEHPQRMLYNGKSPDEELLGM